MLLEKRDDLLTVAALGLLAYLTADVAHHFLGHGGACWLAGGQILRLSSIVLTCSVTSPLIDLAGPIANFLVGVIALWMAGATARGTLKLFATLSAAFNLFWSRDRWRSARRPAPMTGSGR